MKARHLLISILALFALASMAACSVPVEAQSPNASTQVHTRAVINTFATESATGTTAAFDASGAAYHTIYLAVTGGPAACTYRLQGSLDNVTFFDISAADITCTSAIVTFEFGKVARYVRGNLKTLTGGTSPTVTFSYGGY